MKNPQPWPPKEGRPDSSFIHLAAIGVPLAACGVDAKTYMTTARTYEVNCEACVKAIVGPKDADALAGDEVVGIIDSGDVRGQ